MILTKLYVYLLYALWADCDNLQQSNIFNRFLNDFLMIIDRNEPLKVYPMSFNFAPIDWYHFSGIPTHSHLYYLILLLNGISLKHVLVVE